MPLFTGAVPRGGAGSISYWPGRDASHECVEGTHA